MALLCLLGLLVPGPQAQARGNPLYWLCILPFAWWANGLAAYEPRPVRPALIVAVATAPASLAIATVLGKEPLLWTIGAGIALISAALAEYFYRGNMLYREGLRDRQSLSTNLSIIASVEAVHWVQSSIFSVLPRNGVSVPLDDMQGVSETLLVTAQFLHGHQSDIDFAR
ncbi:hypothetical protein ACUQRY_001353 [Enterobacter hormaechei]